MRWVPAWSADRARWFDGAQWVPTYRPKGGGPRDWPRRIVVPVVMWLLVLSAFPTAVLVAVNGLPAGQVIPDDTLRLLAIVGAVCLAPTPLLGFWLGRDGRWLQTLWVAAIGTGLLTAWYVALFLADQSDPSADNEAGAGVAILSLPTFVALLGLLGLGGGVAKLMAWARATRTARNPDRVRVHGI